MIFRNLILHEIKYFLFDPNKWESVYFNRIRVIEEMVYNKWQIRYFIVYLNVLLQIKAFFHEHNNMLTVKSHAWHDWKYSKNTNRTVNLDILPPISITAICTINCDYH